MEKGIAAATSERGAVPITHTALAYQASDFGLAHSPPAAAGFGPQLFCLNSWPYVML